VRSALRVCLVVLGGSLDVRCSLLPGCQVACLLNLQQLSTSMLWHTKTT
jgi:hypothetical protein